MALKLSMALVALLALLAASLPVGPAAAFLWTCSGGGGDTTNAVEIDRASYGSNMAAGRALLSAVNKDSTRTATRFCIDGTSGSGTFDIGTSILQPGPGDDIIGAPATSTTATVFAVGDSPAATAYDPDPYVHIVGSGRAIIQPTTGSHDNYFEWIGFAGATNTGVKQAGRGFDGKRMAGGDSGETGIPDAWFFSVQAYNNDRIGLAGLPWGTLISRTEVKDNGGQASLGTDSGGTKAANPYEVRQSYIHDNLGNGVWCDAGCVDTRAFDMDFWVHDNVIAHNGGDGVRYEHSPEECSTTRANPGCNNKSPRQSALIQHNRVVANGVARAPVDSLRGGVVVNSARRAEVVNNRFGHGTIFGITYSSNQSNAESKNGGKGAAVGHSGSRTSLLRNETHHNAMASGNERYDGCGLSGVYCHDNTGLSTTVAAVGDIVCDPTSAYFDGDTATRCQHRKTLALVTGADAILTLGDHQYEIGTRAKFDQAYDPSWGAVADKTFPSPGNHEYRDPRGDAAGYFGYWGSKGRPTGGAKGYYSWDISPTWHLIALNSSNGPCQSGPACAEGSAQNTWLEEDLAQVPSSDCILAYWHHPLFNSGANNGNENTSAVKAFWTDLYAAGADLILNGHEHNYQRYSQMTPDGVIASSGVREIISGGGGKSLYGLLTTKDSGYQFGTQSFGVLKLDLSTSSYSWRFINLNGTVVDSGGPVSCHT